MKQVDQQAIDERAKTKKDGVYFFRGVVYRVKSGRVTHYVADCKILERCFGFNVVVGAVQIGTSKEAIKKLLQSLE